MSELDKKRKLLLAIEVLRQNEAWILYVESLKVQVENRMEHMIQPHADREYVAGECMGMKVALSFMEKLEDGTKSEIALLTQMEELHGPERREPGARDSDDDINTDFDNYTGRGFNTNAGF